MKSITTAEFAPRLNGLRSMLSLRQGLFLTDPVRLYNDFLSLISELMVLAAGLPTARRHEVRKLLEELRLWSDWKSIEDAYSWHSPSEFAQDVRGCIGKTWRVFSDRLKTMEIDLAAWLPDSQRYEEKMSPPEKVRQSENRKRPLTLNEKNRNQRMKFSCSRRKKNPPMTWADVYDEYHEKYPKDLTASPATLRLTHDRNCPECRRATDS
jgi:hypothetical protein